MSTKDYNYYSNNNYQRPNPSEFRQSKNRYSSPINLFQQSNNKYNVSRNAQVNDHDYSSTSSGPLAASPDQSNNREFVLSPDIRNSPKRQDILYNEHNLIPRYKEFNTLNLDLSQDQDKKQFTQNDKLKNESLNLKNENSKLKKENSELLVNLEKNQDIIKEKEKNICSLNSKLNRIKDFNDKLKNAYTKTDNIIRSISKLIYSELELDVQDSSPKISPVKLIQQLITTKSDQIQTLSLENQNYKKELQNFRNILISKEKDLVIDPKDTELEIFQKVYFDKNAKLNSFSTAYTKLKSQMSLVKKENQDIKQLLIDKGVIQMENPNLNIADSINQIIVEKEQIEKELSPLSEKNKSLKKENNELRCKLLLQMESNITSIQNQYEKINQKLDDISSDTSYMRNKIPFINNIENEVLIGTNNNEISIEKKVLDELIDLFNIQKNENLIEENSENKYGLLIDKIKEMKSQNENFISQKISNDSDNSQFTAQKKVFDELIDLFDIQEDTSCINENSTNKYNLLIDKIMEMRNQNEILALQKIINDRNDEISIEKNTLDKLINILNIFNDSRFKEDDSESNYNLIITKIEELQNQIANENAGNYNNDQEIEELKRNLQHTIDDQAEKIIELNKQKEYLQQQKESSDELLRRHVKLIKTENDKQIRRLKYMQRMEIKELINQS
ncbi:hypothetical protein M9Y10_029042 [Tritrichomonas musculus]|uniref:Uncharacterized protein n=1 Tax=Tritrichomonas musculus TaxID=1915356 RepID=A0ABR2KL12_9EUKA